MLLERRYVLCICEYGSNTKREVDVVAASFLRLVIRSERRNISSSVRIVHSSPFAAACDASQQLQPLYTSSVVPLLVELPLMKPKNEPGASQYRSLVENTL